ncbi:MAG: molybdate ABC transporter substrate-binding protein [Epsilonproteobacteria bacterium]|nr:molybdate ABC transporter substrate-binding protein [Campylobacterota bacterium]
MRWFIVLLVSITLSFSASLKVAVAANMSYAIDALVKDFSSIDPDAKISTTISSSGKLAAQIAHGAPYDIFLSANTSYVAKLYKQHISQKPVVYAYGALVYLSRDPQDFSDLKQLLLSQKVQKIAIANPKTAPYGKAAFEALQNLGVLNQIKHKFIYGESISQTLTYTLRATEIGIVAKSAIFAPPLSHLNNAKHYKDIDAKLYTPIKQAGAIIKNTPLAKKFLSYLQSNRAKKILQKYGYNTP